ncbi:hypothetical protein Hanom_Chr16g01514651 [Helianthus anomalus]
MNMNKKNVFDYMSVFVRFIYVCERPFMFVRNAYHNSWNSRWDPPLEHGECIFSDGFGISLFLVVRPWCNHTGLKQNPFKHNIVFR